MADAGFISLRGDDNAKVIEMPWIVFSLFNIHVDAFDLPPLDYLDDSWQQLDKIVKASLQIRFNMDIGSSDPPSSKAVIASTIQKLTKKIKLDPHLIDKFDCFHSQVKRITGNETILEEETKTEQHLKGKAVDSMRENDDGTVKEHLRRLPLSLASAGTFLILIITIIIISRSS